MLKKFQVKPWLPMSSGILYFLSFFLPSFYKLPPHQFIFQITNYFEAIKENLWGYILLGLLLVAAFAFYKHPKIAQVILLILAVSYLWVTLPTAFSMSFAFAVRVYGYYVNLLIGFALILSLYLWMRQRVQADK
jgi:hypothetical protein